MQNLRQLFYPAPAASRDVYGFKDSCHHNSPISVVNVDADNLKLNEDDFAALVNHRSNSIRIESFDHHLFDSNVSNLQKDSRPSNYSCNDQNPLLYEVDQSPAGLSRGRTLTTSQANSSRKKGVLVIKKESINRQNSQSRSPTQMETQVSTHKEVSQQFFSPKVREFPKFTADSQQQSNTKAGRNSVIVRKTVGELKRAQLNAAYYENQMVKSHGAQSERVDQVNIHSQDIQRIKSYEINGRNSFSTNYHQFIQRTEINPFLNQNKSPQNPSTHPKDPEKSANQEIITTLAQKYAQNRNMREQIRERLNQSSEESEEFDRQSYNTLSMDNLNSRFQSYQNNQKSNSHKGEKKIVIQKNKVNFMQLDHDISSVSKGLIVKVSLARTRDSLLSLNNQRQASDDLFGGDHQAQSPDCALRRQRSDNLISMHSHKKASLKNERSHLALYTSNKLEVPKVLKAVPGTFCQEIMQSPTTYSSQKGSQSNQHSSGIGIIGFNSGRQELTAQPKSRQNNIFQARRSQTIQGEKRPEDDKKIVNLHQKRENLLKNEKFPKKINIQTKITTRNNETSRISQSLLLDNFYSKSKERLSQRTNEDESAIKQDTVEKSPKKSQSPKGQKNSPDISFPIQQTFQEQKKSDMLLVPPSITQNRRNTLSYSINRLIDENRCNSPVRLSQYLVDIDSIKAKAQERIVDNKPRTTTNTQSSSKNGIEIYNKDSNQGSSTMSQSNSNNAILSLSSVNTTEKFKEIIDNLFVPTASAFKKKGKEREFRRPTQNPIRRSKSQQRTNKLVNQKDPEYQEGINYHDAYHVVHESDETPHASNIVEEIDILKQRANFSTEQIKIRDDLVVNVFVHHVQLNQKGQVVERVDQEETKNGDDNLDLDSDEEEDEIDAEKDDEEEIQITNKYSVDLVAQYKDLNEDLILHWGVGRKVPCEWTGPDEKCFPPETKRFGDGKACQTKFQKDRNTPIYRQIHIDFSWLQDIEQPIKSMSYVLMEQKKNCWHNNGGRDFHIKFQIEPEHHSKNKNLPFGKIGDVVQEIIDCETVYVINRNYQLYIELMDTDAQIQQMQRHSERQNRPGKQRSHVYFQINFNRAYLFIWLRYSFTKQLTWQKSYNTKPKDLQWAQVCLTDEIVGQFTRVRGKNRTEFLTSGDLLRSMLTMIGKGSGNGQRVRDEILNIMHRHKIPETAGHFYEQWHQKLHNNTTPDDIYICEALLAYLKSGGNMSKYWEHLNKNGITKERLASYERKITTEPWMKPEAIGSFEEYLTILKQMHSSGDLELLSNEAKQHVGNDTKGLIDDLMRNYNDSDTLRQMERVSKLRYNLHQSHMDFNNHRKLKDIMFLDLALEAYLRGLTERIIHIDIGFEAYIREAAIILSNLVLSYSWEELAYCKDDWDKIVQPNCKDMNEDNARKLKSVVDRVKQSLGEVTDQFSNVIQTKAELLGKEFQLDQFAYKIFAEDVIRGTLFFSLSMILKKIDPHIRKCAHLGDWLIISQGRSHGSRGYVEKVKHLYDVMHHTYEKRTILLCEKINGEEEVPNNVQAIVLIDGTDYPDVLAHVSVRARNLKVMFLVCFDENKINDLCSLIQRHIFMAIDNHMIKYYEQSPNTPITRRASSSLILQNIIDNAKNVKAPPEFEKSFMQIDEFNPKNMGAKSNNLKVLRDGLDQWILLPQSGCIPFQMMEYSLRLEPEIEKEVNELIDKLANCKSFNRMNRILLRCKDLVMKLSFHKEDKHHQFLQQALVNFGIPTNQLLEAWKTIKMVWASKFNERAFLATKKIGVSLHAVYMAVLVQRVIPAEYAYVIHTTNPTNGEDEEVYVESCLGMGEALVSTMPGQAFSFTYSKSTERSSVNAYPNKPMGLKADGFIFRSDSNSEDLPGFAGAGLFDSYPMTGTKEFRIHYNTEKLIIDKQFRENFMNNIGKIGMAIENLYGESQDIEGAYYNGKFHVVQTRPQV